jgi:hypothetical protein
MLLHHAKVDFEEVRGDVKGIKYHHTNVFRIPNLPVFEMN